MRASTPTQISDGNLFYKIHIDSQTFPLCTYPARLLQVATPMSVITCFNKTKRDAREILSYFVRNPQAADTLDGIVRWRLLSEVVHRKVEETSVAIEWLVEQGLLLETRSPGVGPIFSLNPEKISEAQCILDAGIRTSSQKKTKEK